MEELVPDIDAAVARIQEMLKESLVSCPEKFEGFCYQDGLTHALQELMNQEAFWKFLHMYILDDVKPYLRLIK